MHMSPLRKQLVELLQGSVWYLFNNATMSKKSHELMGMWFVLNIQIIGPSLMSLMLCERSERRHEFDYGLVGRQ